MRVDVREKLAATFLKYFEDKHLTKGYPAYVAE
jgi:hypothetical protein